MAFFSSWPRIVWRVLAVFSVLVCAWIGLGEARLYDTQKAKSEGASIRIDWDTNDFADEIERTPHFSDTLRWWSGPWMEKVPYYRPLTISLFWAQYQVFGPQGRIAFTWVHRLSHIAFLLLLLGFFAALFGLGRATLGVSLFALGANQGLLLPTGTDAFNCWKDQCDVWSAISCVAACWMIFRWSQSAQTAKKPFWRAPLWWLAMAFYLVGLTIKELGMLTPIFLALTLFFAGQLGKNWRALTPFFVISPLFWCLRIYFLGGWGNKTGAGDAWPTRFLSQVMGWPSSLIAGDGLPLAMLGFFGIVGALFWWRLRRENRFPGRFAAISGGFLLCGAVLAHRFLPDAPEVQIARFWMGTLPFDTFIIALIGGGFALMLWQLRRGDKRLFFAWLWIVVGFTPLMVQPPTSPHVHYPIAPGWSLWLACLAFYAFDWTKARAVFRAPKISI